MILYSLERSQFGGDDDVPCRDYPLSSEFLLYKVGGSI